MRINDIDIMYYESMIDMVVETRKIMEHCFSESAQSVLSENSSIMAIYEGKVIDTIKDSIKRIIQKVIDFVRDIMKKITGGDIFKQNETLVKKGKEKLRNMSAEEKEDFLIREILLENLKDNDEWAKSMIINSDFYMNKNISNYTGYIRYPKYHEEPKSNNEEIDKILSELDKLENKNERKLEDVDIEIIEKILNSSGYHYANAKNITSELINKCKEIEDKMNKSISEIDRYIVSAKEKELSSSLLNRYRSDIYTSATCTIKLLKFSLKTKAMMFKNEEMILRKFLAY